jgi:lipid-binding SYLF domain-containing protein
MKFISHNSQTIAVVAGAVALAACSSSSSSQSAETTAAKADSARADTLERLDQAAQVVTQLGSQIPDEVAARTQCVIAVPSMVKAGVIIGGAGGKGYATCQNASGWSAPAPISIGGGTFGAQLGVQSTELLALVETEKGMNALATGNFKVGVDASATAGPVGTGRGTGTDISSGGDLVSYSRSKGLFAGANLNGTSVTRDDDASRALYGSPYELKAILDGRVAPPNMPASQRFLNAVSTGFGKGRTAKVSSVAP